MGKEQIGYQMTNRKEDWTNRFFNLFSTIMKIIKKVIKMEFKTSSFEIVLNEFKLSLIFFPSTIN